MLRLLYLTHCHLILTWRRVITIGVSPLHRLVSLLGRTLSSSMNDVHIRSLWYMLFGRVLGSLVDLCLWLLRSYLVLWLLVLL